MMFPGKGSPVAGSMSGESRDEKSPPFHSCQGDVREQGLSPHNSESVVGNQKVQVFPRIGPPSWNPN